MCLHVSDMYMYVHVCVLYKCFSLTSNAMIGNGIASYAAPIYHCLHDSGQCVERRKVRWKRWRATVRLNSITGSGTA